MLPGDVGDDQGVELSVHLEHAPPVNGDDVLVGLDPGPGHRDVGAVEGHRPVAHHHPVVKLPPLAHKVVVFHAAVGGQGLHILLPVNAAVDEDVLPRL